MTATERIRTMRRDGVISIVGLGGVSVPWGPMSELDRRALLILQAGRLGQSVPLPVVLDLLNEADRNAPALEGIGDRLVRALNRGQGAQVIVELASAALDIGRERGALLALLRKRCGGGT